MAILIQLVKRNLRLYLRDKASVFFSFLSVIIIIMMYALFLGRMQIENLKDTPLGDVDGIDWLVSAWIMAGLVTVSTVTVPLSALGALIEDKDKGLFNDFYTSPINRNVLALSYLISSWVIGFLMVMLNFLLGIGYVLINGGEMFSPLQTVKLIGLIMLSIMTFSSFFFFLATFMKSRNAFGLLSTLVGTFVGFLGGIYIPIGILSDNVQNVMNLFPTAHSVTLVRRLYLEGAIQKVFIDTNAPVSVLDNYKDMYGLNVHLFGTTLSSGMMFLSLILFMVIFYALSVLKLSRGKLQ